MRLRGLTSHRLCPYEESEQEGKHYRPHPMPISLRYLNSGPQTAEHKECKSYSDATVVNRSKP